MNLERATRAERPGDGNGIDRDASSREVVALHTDADIDIFPEFAGPIRRMLRAVAAHATPWTRFHPAFVFPRMGSVRG